jgi:hypothetical protein
MISFTWKLGGSWIYKNNEQVPDLSVLVSLVDGTHAPINHLPVTTVGTLGGGYVRKVLLIIASHIDEDVKVVANL